MPDKKKEKRQISIGKQTEQEWDEHKKKTLTPSQQVSYSFYLDRIEKAREQKESVHRLFDDMTYSDDYISNENAKNTYLRQKLNDSEVRIATGVTEKKIEVVVNEILSLNLQPEIRAFDKNDNLLQELGDSMTDIVTRTNEIEKDADVWEQAVIEVLTQRAVFMTEKVETITSRNGTQTHKIIKKEMRDGRNVFLGDITVPAHKFQEQPYVVYYDSMHWRRAQQIWGNHPKWQEVLKGISDEFNLRTGAWAYRMGILEDLQVEIVQYISTPDNERQFIVNGVMMFEPGTSETNIPWKHPGYNTSMTILKSLSSKFAYGKPLTASAKTLQGLSDEGIRLTVRKWQQALEPPTAFNGEKVPPRDIWDPGSMVSGIGKKNFEKLIDHDGVTQGEFNMLDYIDRKTEEFIGGGGDLGQGLNSGDRTTATESLLQQKNAVKQLGLAVLAVSRLKRDMTELRVYSTLEEHLKPKGRKMDPLSKIITDTYSGFTIENTQLENGQKGTKRIEFMDRDLTGEEKQEVFDEETRLEKAGINFRLKTVNAKTLRNLFINWFVVIHPQEKEGSTLDKIVFQDQLVQGQAISQITQTPLNPKVLQEDFERKWKAKDWFQASAPNQLNQEQDPAQEKVKAEAEKLLGGLGENSSIAEGQQGANALAKSAPPANTAVGQI